MKELLPPVLAAILLLMPPARAIGSSILEVRSPNHAQTFAYGSERQRSWMMVGRHLAVVMHFTNDPYVDNDNPRRYDDFTFDFPNVVLGGDGRTFYYHPSGKGGAVPVAVRSPGFFGDEATLLPSSFLVVQQPHGLLSLTLLLDPNRKMAGP